MEEEDRLVRVHTAQGWHLAQIYKSKLEAAEIPVLLKYDALSIVYGITVDGLGAVDVMVPARYADDARALLEDQEEPSEELDEDEPDAEGPDEDESDIECPDKDKGSADP